MLLHGRRRLSKSQMGLCSYWPGMMTSLQAMKYNPSHFEILVQTLGYLFLGLLESWIKDSTPTIRCIAVSHPREEVPSSKLPRPLHPWPAIAVPELMPWRFMFWHGPLIARTCRYMSGHKVNLQDSKKKTLGIS